MPDTASARAPVRLAIMNDYSVIVTGVEHMLRPFADRIEIVELVSLLPVESPIDVLLYDTYSRERVTGPVEQVIAETNARVVLYTWHLEENLVSEALTKGSRGCLSKALSPDELVRAIEQVHQGTVVVSPDPGPEAPVTAEEWPGKEHGLSPRESEVLALIAQGLSNQEIAARAYLSINSIKTYIRSCYRKIGVTRRTQAVLWATEHGFVPQPVRIRRPDGRESASNGRA